MVMCECFVTVLERAKVKIAEDLPKNADIHTLNITWKHRVFRLDGKGNNVIIPLDIEYYRTKTSGIRYANKTKEEISMAMKFCPFCGLEF